MRILTGDAVCLGDNAARSAYGKSRFPLPRPPTNRTKALPISRLLLTVQRESASAAALFAENRITRGAEFVSKGSLPGSSGFDRRQSTLRLARQTLCRRGMIY